jgi:hypothetical protein
VAETNVYSTVMAGSLSDSSSLQRLKMGLLSDGLMKRLGPMQLGHLQVRMLQHDLVIGDALTRSGFYNLRSTSRVLLLIAFYFLPRSTSYRVLLLTAFYFLSRSTYRVLLIAFYFLPRCFSSC